jgi:hypothetical protein
MATTVGETVSRVRNVIKGVKQDAFLTDRFLYSLILKWARVFIKRQDDQNKITRIDSLFKSVCLDMIEVDRIECGCGSITSDCTFMRTEQKLPEILEGAFGPIIRAVSSVDISQKAYRVQPTTFQAMANSTNYKYNKNKYFWILNGYMYMPNVMWESVRVEAMWQDDISYLKCEEKDQCTIRQNQPSNIPDYLYAEIEQSVLNELGFTLKIPGETTQDNQNILRT